MSPDIAALHDRQAATLEAMQIRLTEAHERLASAGEQAGRLAAANDGLARANRALIDAAGNGWGQAGDDAARAALEAEVEALRAARAAEVAQMSEILDALDRMLGVTTTPRSHSTDARTPRRSPARERTAARSTDRAARADAQPTGNGQEPAKEVAAVPGAEAVDSPPAAPPKHPSPGPDLTVIRDEDPLPEDMAPVDDLSADPLPEDRAADADRDDPRAQDMLPEDRALFGGVYDDDPDARDDTDDEERR